VNGAAPTSRCGGDDCLQRIQPVQFHSDQGANLVKLVGAAMADLLNIYRTRNIAFHPIGNGAADWAVRKSIKVIFSIITGEVNSDPPEWDISCPKAALAINTLPSSLTLQMPWLVKHPSCSKAILPVSIMADDLPSVRRRCRCPRPPGASKENVPSGVAGYGCGVWFSGS
jgi:hypothetical protein